jgi:hypothetical protein
VTDYQEHLLDSSHCVIAFAASGGEFGDLDHYAFGHSLHDLGVAHVLMRDTKDFWYQHGVDGIKDGRIGVVAYIVALSFRYPRIILTGVSSGAYAALLYGQLASGISPAGLEVTVFSPCTGLGESVCADFEAHWHHRVRHPPGEQEILDLKTIYANGPSCTVRAFISDGDGTELDWQMATRIGCHDITLIPGASHAGLAKMMRDQGYFRKLFA